MIPSFTPLRFLSPLFLAIALVSIANAQTTAAPSATPSTAPVSYDNPFIVPTTGFPSFTAGQPGNLSWHPTTQGTITIVLRSGNAGNLIAGALVARTSRLSTSFQPHLYCMTLCSKPCLSECYSVRATGPNVSTSSHPSFPCKSHNTNSRPTQRKSPIRVHSLGLQTSPSRRATPTLSRSSTTPTSSKSTTPPISSSRIRPTSSLPRRPPTRTAYPAALSPLTLPRLARTAPSLVPVRDSASAQWEEALRLPCWPPSYKAVEDRRTVSLGWLTFPWV